MFYFISKILELPQICISQLPVEMHPGLSLPPGLKLPRLQSFPGEQLSSGLWLHPICNIFIDLPKSNENYCSESDLFKLNSHTFKNILSYSVFALNKLYPFCVPVKTWIEKDSKVSKFMRNFMYKNSKGCSHTCKHVYSQE